MEKAIVTVAVAALAALSMAGRGLPGARGKTVVPCTQVLLLDGAGWRLAHDAGNVGRQDRWFEGPRPDAVDTHVPWVVQQAFPGKHGIFWYWRTETFPVHPLPGGRYLLRFQAVDYLADVWLNGKPVGRHEGGEEPFTLDVTEAARPGQPNLLAVRVLNPTNEPIDGIVLAETPHRNKVVPYAAGNCYDHGGITDSVELLLTPAVWIEDLYARADAATGGIRARVTLHSALRRAVKVRAELSVAPAAEGGTLQTVTVEGRVLPGATVLECDLRVDHPRLWELQEPFLYRVTARAGTSQAAGFDERNVRSGFRDFRFERGAFRLNGRRIFLRCSHTGNACPVGFQLPVDPDWLRRDLLNVKVMGFNSIRFISGVATRRQLDLCDEIGLMVYEEHYGSWCLADSPHMAERYDAALTGMVRRDRNHPCVILWGLLNETSDGAVFRHAVSALPMVRALDQTRVVMLNSGRFDRGPADDAMVGLDARRSARGPDPNVTHNPTDHDLSGLGIVWKPGQLALHPGPKGERSAVRWVAPAAGAYRIRAVFTGIAGRATTDVHVLCAGRSLFDNFVNLSGHGNSERFEGVVQAAKGGTVDFVVGPGTADYGGDTTALDAQIEGPGGKVFGAAGAFSLRDDPDAPWRYGELASAPQPDASTFQPYAVVERQGRANVVGSLSNPGSAAWEDVLDDRHPYQRVPQNAAAIRNLRSAGGGGLPLFLSEYGVGSAVDLVRAARHYEQLGATQSEDAVFYRDKLDRFLADWDRWKLSECFADPEDFFRESQRRMARERLYGLNAIRSNPRIVGHSLTGTVDQGMSGEGLFTTFRELKPGTTDALFEALYPLRLCLFASPDNVTRGGTAHLEAVLANEDALPAGEYRIRVQVVGPDLSRPLERTVTVQIPKASAASDPPLAIPVFRGDVRIDGPAGRYRFRASIERGGAASGGEATFQVMDAAAMPPMPATVTLWGSDDEMTAWLRARGVRVDAYAAGRPGKGRVILAAAAPPGTGDAAVWRDLAERIGEGAAVVFLSPQAFRRGDDAVGWLPLQQKGRLEALPAWLYHKDEWAKAHPVFDGLPCRGMVDYDVYREIIPDLAFTGQVAPDEAVAGGCNASIDYSSGLLVSTHRLGGGRFLLNTLLVRENLGSDPVAELLLRNMLRWAASAAENSAPGSLRGEDLDALGYR